MGLLRAVMYDTHPPAKSSKKKSVVKLDEQLDLSHFLYGTDRYKSYLRGRLITT